MAPGCAFAPALRLAPELLCEIPMHLPTRILMATAIAVFSMMMIHEGNARGESCNVYYDDTPLPEIISSSCDLVFLSERGGYEIDDLIVEVSVSEEEGWIPIVFEGQHRPVSVRVDYGLCDQSTCTYERWTEQRMYELYELSPAEALPDGARVRVSSQSEDGPVLEFWVDSRLGSCFEEGYLSTSCTDRECGIPPYTECYRDDEGSGRDEQEGGGGCSAGGNHRTGWLLGLILVASMLSWRRRRSSREALDRSGAAAV